VIVTHAGCNRGRRSTPRAVDKGTINRHYYSNGNSQPTTLLKPSDPVRATCSIRLDTAIIARGRSLRWRGAPSRKMPPTRPSNLARLAFRRVLLKVSVRRRGRRAFASGGPGRRNRPPFRASRLARHASGPDAYSVCKEEKIQTLKCSTRRGHRWRHGCFVGQSA
jgi:hypothetical protein